MMVKSFLSLLIFSSDDVRDLQNTRLFKDEATEEKGDRARMVRNKFRLSI